MCFQSKAVKQLQPYLGFSKVECLCDNCWSQLLFHNRNNALSSINSIQYCLILKSNFSVLPAYNNEKLLMLVFSSEMKS